MGTKIIWENIETSNIYILYINNIAEMSKKYNNQ